MTEVARRVDRLAAIHPMQADSSNHAPASFQPSGGVGLVSGRRKGRRSRGNRRPRVEFASPDQADFLDFLELPFSGFAPALALTSTSEPESFFRTSPRT